MLDMTSTIGAYASVNLVWIEETGTAVDSISISGANGDSHLKSFVHDEAFTLSTDRSYNLFVLTAICFPCISALWIFRSRFSFSCFGFAKSSRPARSPDSWVVKFPMWDCFSAWLGWYTRFMKSWHTLFRSNFVSLLEHIRNIVAVQFTVFCLSAKTVLCFLLVAVLLNDGFVVLNTVCIWQSEWLHRSDVRHRWTPTKVILLFGI